MCEILNVHAYDWIVKDREGDDEQTVIDCWALDVDSTPCLLRILDFPVFCFIELPMIIRGKEYKWTLATSKTLMITINKLLGYSPSIKSEFFYCSKLHFYQGNRKSPFIRAYFKNVREMNSCKYKLENPIYTEFWGCIKCTVFENQISVIRKLLTLRNIRFSKWFEVVGVKVQEELKISTLEDEYIINWQSMTPIAEDLCKNWITNPGVLSWDIECYSDNHLAMPDKYNDTDVAYMVSAIYKKYKIHSTIKRYGVLIGECHHIPEEKLHNCTIIKVSSEYAMVEAFAKIVRETDPEILVGYNILSFDYPYLDHRVLRQQKDWPKMSRLIGEVPVMNSTNWKSSAYGNNSINNLKISGRISIDLLPIIRRDYKFESYTLNFVCLHFLEKQKNDVSPQEMFIRYQEMQTALENYNENPDLNFEKLEKAKTRTTEVMEYCIKDSELVLDLMENQDVWIGLIELSNIVGVTIVEIFTKGQQVRCVSQLYDLASRKNIVLNIRDEATFRFSGGSVQKPIPGLYENVICLDFKSLYPSIIQALNICYTTLVHPDHMAYIKDEDCHVVEFTQQEEEMQYKKSIVNEDEEIDLDADSSSDEEELEKVMVEKHYKFKYYKHKEGLLPLLVKNLVAERNSVRGQQKNEKNPNVKMVLEKRQLALKCSANSVAGNTPIPCLINGKFEYKMIEELFHSHYETLDNGIQLCTGYEIKVWSDAGWADIHYVGRHEAPKDMMRVLTHTGCVDVTKDHSLLDLDGNEVTVNDVEVGDELMHVSVPLPEDTPDDPMYFTNLNNNFNTIEEEDAYLAGIMYDKIFPQYILTSPYLIRLAFFIGLNSKNMSKESQLSNASMYYLMRSLGYKISINHDQLVYSINEPQIKKIQNIQSIQSIISNDKIDYVYDIETSTHHFAAGVGDMIVHNSFFGFLGVREGGKMPCMEAAMSITAKGRELIGQVATYLNDKYQAKIVYGDSVTYDTPILCKQNNLIQYLTIDQMGSSWESYGDKEASVCDYEAWTEKGWTKIHKVIRHYTDKDIYRVLTHTGCVDVTSDHSLLNEKAEKIKPIDVKVGDSLLHADLPNEVNVDIDENEAFAMGVFMAHGSCDRYWLMHHSNYDILNRIKNELTIVYGSEISFNLIKDTYFTLMPSGNVKSLTLKYKNLFYDGKNKIIPNIILNASLRIKQLFLEGYGVVNVDNKIEAAKLYYIGNHKNNNVIKKITNLGKTIQYVYDLETDNHHFSAGIGKIIVHNTDSVMVDLKITDSTQCQYWGEKLSQEISGVKKGQPLPGFMTKDRNELRPDQLHPEAIAGLFLSPLEMEFEKAMRLFCIKPKKYAAYLIDKRGDFIYKCLKDANGQVVKKYEEYEMLIRGIVLARRDNNMFLRILYKSILNIIMSKGKFKDAILLLIDTIIDLLEDKIPPKELKSSRELGAHYKQPSFFMKVFADELRKKNKIVNPGDRLEFVVIENKEATLAGQRMVLMTDYIDSLKTDTPYKLDYIHYIEKVLVNPIDQLFEIGFVDYLELLKHIQYHPPNKRKPITLKTPTEMIMHMICNKCNIKEFRKALVNYMDKLDNTVITKVVIN